MAQVDGGEADKKRNGGDDFKIDQTLDADAAHGAQVAVTRDAGDERGQDERGDDDLDQAQKNVAQEAQAFGELRMVQADFKSEQHGEKDPEGERALADGGY